MDAQSDPVLDLETAQLVNEPPPTPVTRRFFERTDWLSFAVTFVLILMVYLYTLMPSVGLGNDGVFTTAATYGGVPNPPGFPVWTMYAHLFTWLLPFSNLAWRVSVSSAVAGALACGLIALMVSRGGTLILEGVRDFRRLDLKDEMWLRIVAGCVAGMAFGLDDSLWGRALTPDPWPLSLLLFASMLCLLLRWRQSPARTRWLYAAMFVYGLALTNSQSFLGAALGIEFIILSANAPLGRDIFVVSSLLLGTTIGTKKLGLQMDAFSSLFYLGDRMYPQFWLAILTTLMGLGLLFKTRALFTNWKTVIGCGVFVSLGFSACFFLPLASVANPPMNWGYPRTVEGFFHVITRGQYDRAYPVAEWDRFLGQVGLYLEMVLTDYGWVYLLPIAMPFFFLHRMRANERNGIFGLIALFLCMSFFMLAIVNPSTDRQSSNLNRIFFASSHLILAIWTGYGLLLLGTMLARPKNNPRRQ